MNIHNKNLPSFAPYLRQKDSGHVFLIMKDMIFNQFLFGSNYQRIFIGFSPLSFTFFCKTSFYIFFYLIIVSFSKNWKQKHYKSLFIFHFPRVFLSFHSIQAIKFLFLVSFYLTFLTFLTIEKQIWTFIYLLNFDLLKFYLTILNL